MEKEIISKFGIDVVDVDNGFTAIEVCKQQQFDIILMDIRMPNIDGYETCKKIRTYSMNRKTPIIALTADAETGVKEKTLSVGMNDYIPKPIDFNSLALIMNKYFRTDYSYQNTEFDTICIFNEKKCISKLNGNKNILNNLIKSFTSMHSKDCDDILSYLKDGCLFDVCMLLHSLKGISGNLCFESLADTCKELERNIKEDSISSDTIELFKEVFNDTLSTANKFLTNNSVLLETYNEDLKQIVNKIIVLCEDCDIDAITIFEENKGLFKHKISTSDYSKIKKYAMEYNFSDLVKVLKSIEI